MEMKWRTAEVEASAQGPGGRGNAGQFNLADQKGSGSTSDCKDLLGLYCATPLFQKISVALGRESQDQKSRFTSLMGYQKNQVQFKGVHLILLDS